MSEEKEMVEGVNLLKVEDPIDSEEHLMKPSENLQGDEIL